MGAHPQIWLTMHACSSSREVTLVACMCAMAAESSPGSVLAATSAFADQVLQHADADIKPNMPAKSGPHPTFSMEDGKAKMLSGGAYFGSASNLFVCNLSQPPPAQPPYTMAELDQIINNDWDVKKVVMAGSNSRLRWKRPVICAVTAVGEIHDLRMLSNQKPVMAFLKGWLRWLDAPVDTPHR